MDLNSTKFKIIEGANIDPPIEQLYYSGVIPNLNNSIAVVGSRRVSEYGKRVCREFVGALAQVGLTVVSGLMYGIDIEAHNAAISAGGKTLGVLGYGHDYLKHYGYAQNMYEKILELKAGAVVSEYEPDAPAAKWTFPKRNRIIAALSRTVLVIEGGENSGSLITAGYAIEQGKDVFAVPGSIYNQNSNGTNWLIKQGAHIATSPQDILMFFNKIAPGTVNFHSNLDTDEVKLLDTIEKLDQMATAPKLAEVLKMPISELNAKLSKLELSGYIIKDIAGRLSALR